MASPASVEKVTSVTHYTDSLFSFKITRPETLRFKPGQFIMLGLKIDNKPLMRAYSIASGPYDEELEFYSIKIPDGPLTSKLQHIKFDDEILLGSKAVGNLTPWDVRPGKRLFLLSTGTGIAPFASILRDPETYDGFETVVLTHTCRLLEDLAYGRRLLDAIKGDPLCGEEAVKKLLYYPSVTQEENLTDSISRGRITELIESQKLFEDLHISPFNYDIDRVMVCGSMGMVKDMGKILNSYNMSHSSGKEHKEYAYERAFVG